MNNSFDYRNYDYANPVYLNDVSRVSFPPLPLCQATPCDGPTTMSFLEAGGRLENKQLRYYPPPV